MPALRGDSDPNVQPILNRSGWIALTAVLLLAACGDQSDTLAAPGPVSEGEAEFLSDAAEMLEERDAPDGAEQSGEPSEEMTGDTRP